MTDPQQLARDTNPRLLPRQDWWIRFGCAMTAHETPICTECGDSMPDAPFVGAFVCEKCAPYVPESERWQ